MNAAGRSLIISSILLGGCQTAHDVAVTSYHVATAPVRFIHRQISGPSTTETTTTTTTTTSDVATPGQLARPAVSTQRTTGSQGAALPAATPRVARREVKPRPKPSPSPHAASTQLEFPTAKPVAGKPGYVYSPSDPSKYVDVSGYAPGSKVKDPYSGKIFLVPQGGE
jgi:hypothetical protein